MGFLWQIRQIQRIATVEPLIKGGLLSSIRRLGVVLESVNGSLASHNPERIIRTDR